MFKQKMYIQQEFVNKKYKKEKIIMKKKIEKNLKVDLA